MDRFNVLLLESTDNIIKSTFSPKAKRSVLFSFLSLERFDFFIKPIISLSLSNSTFRPLSSISIILPVTLELSGLFSIYSCTGSFSKCFIPRLILSLSALISSIFTFSLSIFF